MKKYNEVYKRLFIIYTAILITCVLSLDAYFIYYSKKNIKNQKLYLNKKMIEDIELELIKNNNSVDRIVNGIYDQSFIATDLINLLNNDFDCSISRLNNKIIGLQFKNITPDKMKVIMSIFTENMQPHYDNKKIQNYIITDNKESICA